MLLLLALGGCESPAQSDGEGILLVVPGVNGDGPWYGSLRNGLRDGGVAARVQTFGWGMPGPLFALNFNSKTIHDAAEQRFARRLSEIAQKNPGAPIVILAHSAGCGVTLGALLRLKDETRVERVVLLHPSLSPQYDLSPSLLRINQKLTVFHSNRDTTFLQWRTSNFGTYDSVRTIAAGNSGFDLSGLSIELRKKVVQVPYEYRFEGLGNDGGHFAVTSRRFIAEIVAPLLK
jgi:pimeloyl-ACP methyl ester carboxylesterase